MHASMMTRAVSLRIVSAVFAALFGLFAAKAANAQFSTGQPSGPVTTPAPAQPPRPQAPRPTAVPPAAPAPAPSFGGRSVEGIAAVVNDDIISMSDLNARVQLSLLSSGLPETAETRQRLTPQVLRSLVDERLQLQEAKRLNINVSQAEIDEALKRLAEQNRMTDNQLEQLLASKGVPKTTMVSQIRATLAWGKLIQRRIRPTIDVGEDEIDAALQRIQANAGKPEYLVSEIFLAVDNADQDEQVRQVAQRLVEQISQGASFPAVARQFSQSAGAAAGGDIGWVQQGQLPDEIDSALRQLRPGQVSRPVRSVTGYHILALRDERTVAAANTGEMKVGLKQLFLPTGPGVDPAALRQQAEQIRQTLRGCDAMTRKAAELDSKVSGDLGTVKVADLPPELARVVTTLPVGEPSQTLANERGLLILMVCERDMPTGNLPPRDQIMAQIGQERMDMLQRRLLRDLRRSAFVDLRV
jgi:peptidyl-prolyl cis-trans isomerase SurA